MTDSPLPAAALVEARYAAVQVVPARRRRWGVLVAVMVAVLGLGGVSYVSGAWRKLLPAAKDEFSIHVVRPATLSITLKEEGELKPVNSVDLKCEVQAQGLKIEWVIEESTHVEKDDLLLRLACDEVKERFEQEEMEVRKIQAAFEEAEENLKITESENASRIKKAEVDLEVAKLELERYLEGDYQKSFTSANIEIKRTETELARRRDELEKSEPLVERGFVTKAKLQELRDEVERLEMTLDKNRLELHILENYERKKNEKQKTTAVAQAQEELDRELQRAAARKKQAEVRVEDQRQLLELRRKRLERLREQLGKCEIRAPVAGVVQYGDSGGARFWGGNRIAVGEQVYPGQTLLTIPDTSSMMVTTRIHEADRHKVSEGMTCLVKVPAAPGHTLTGKLKKIAKFADSENRWLNPNLKEHAAEIALDDTEAQVSPGDTASIEILIEEVHDVLAVPVQCVFARGPKHFVFVRRGISPEPVEVEVGRSSASMVEITAGVREGDQVLMAPDDRLLAMLPTPPPTAPGAASPEPPKPRGPARPMQAAQRQ